MAKATLEFDLDNHEDRKAHMRSIKSLDMSLAIFEISCNLRKSCESELDSLKSKDNSSVVDMVFEKIYAIFEQHNINVDELVD